MSSLSVSLGKVGIYYESEREVLEKHYLYKHSDLVEYWSIPWPIASENVEAVKFYRKDSARALWSFRGFIDEFDSPRLEVTSFKSSGYLWFVTRIYCDGQYLVAEDETLIDELLLRRKNPYLGPSPFHVLGNPGTEKTNESSSSSLAGATIPPSPSRQNSNPSLASAAELLEPDTSLYGTETAPDVSQSLEDLCLPSLEDEPSSTTEGLSEGISGGNLVGEMRTRKDRGKLRWRTKQRMARRHHEEGGNEAIDPADRG